MRKLFLLVVAILGYTVVTGARGRAPRAAPSAVSLGNDDYGGPATK